MINVQDWINNFTEWWTKYMYAVVFSYMSQQAWEHLKVVLTPDNF